MFIEPNDRLLFIGDSITDVGRKRDDFYDLGKGYPKIVAEKLARDYPESHIEVLNRGIGGDKLINLRQRFDTDCLALKPDVVSILIGVNDVWHLMDKNEALLTQGRLRAFENDYRYLLDILQAAGCSRIVLMEPYVLPHPEKRLRWRKHLDPRIHIIRTLAKEYHTKFVPLDGMLNALGIKDSYAYYTGKDGVHPTAAGHQAIAKQWCDWVLD